MIFGASVPLLGVAVADGSAVADGVSRAEVGSGVGLGAAVGVLVSVFGVSMSVLPLGCSGAYDGWGYRRRGPRCMVSSLPSTVTRRSECIVRDCEQAVYPMVAWK